MSRVAGKATLGPNRWINCPSTLASAAVWASASLSACKESLLLYSRCLLPLSTQLSFEPMTLWVDMAPWIPMCSVDGWTAEEVCCAPLKHFSLNHAPRKKKGLCPYIYLCIICCTHRCTLGTYNILDRAKRTKTAAVWAFFFKGWDLHLCMLLITTDIYFLMFHRKKVYRSKLWNRILKYWSCADFLVCTIFHLDYILYVLLLVVLLLVKKKKSF